MRSYYAFLSDPNTLLSSNPRSLQGTVPAAVAQEHQQAAAGAAAAGAVVVPRRGASLAAPHHGGSSRPAATGGAHRAAGVEDEILAPEVAASVGVCLEIPLDAACKAFLHTKTWSPGSRGLKV